jgi:hypothetical protein
MVCGFPALGLLGFWASEENGVILKSSLLNEPIREPGMCKEIT